MKGHILLYVIIRNYEKIIVNIIFDFYIIFWSGPSWN